MSEKQVSLYIAVSLDGYIADEDGSVSWLESIDSEGDAGYEAFFDNVDTVVMGRTTYQQIFSLTDTFPYSKKDVYVFSNTKAGTQDEYADFVSGTVDNWLNEISGEHVWLVGGAQLVKQFLKEKAIDRFVLTIAPIILGKGIPLFEQDDTHTLELEEVARFGQFAQLIYRNVEE
ncbi:dihydrofolate reductase family protein [Listeria ilorinensis]|uniref:dihydrofolate reductase family protein n=1 Tax=Listeria ilorinensis TaxID=2867439 RepID=UPI001EF64797|nr:dihydrofolate reductase family protein [Listeria ilorinensis]